MGMALLLWGNAIHLFEPQFKKKESAGNTYLKNWTVHVVLFCRSEGFLKPSFTWSTKSLQSWRFRRICKYPLHARFTPKSSHPRHAVQSYSTFSRDVKERNLPTSALSVCISSAGKSVSQIAECGAGRWQRRSPAKVFFHWVSWFCRQNQGTLGPRRPLCRVLCKMN